MIRGLIRFLFPFLLGVVVSVGCVAPVFFAFGAANESQACDFGMRYFPSLVTSPGGNGLAGDVVDEINASFMGGRKDVTYVADFWYPTWTGSKLVQIVAKEGSVDISSEPIFALERNERGGFVEVLDPNGSPVLYYWLPMVTVKKLVDPDMLLVPDVRDIEYAIREEGILYWIDMTVAEDFLGPVSLPSNLELPGLPFGSQSRLQVPGWVWDLLEALKNEFG